MKIYISGPMTNIKDLNKKAFSEAAERIKKLGYEVVNPHDIANDGSWRDAMRQDIKAMMDCDAIYLLHGYEDSRGAMIEYRIAKMLDMIEIKEDQYA